MKNIIPTLLIILSLSVDSTAQIPAPTPDSIEKMFGEEINKVRGIDKSAEGERQHKALIEALLERLTVGDINRRYEASVLLERELRKEDIPTAVRFLKENPGDLRLRIPVIKALGSTKSPLALDHLRSEFNQGEIPVQLAVIDALAQIPDPLVANMLQDILLSGDNAKVHVRAASALGKIGGDRALYVLNAMQSKQTSAPVKRAVDWALRYATGDLSEGKTDLDIEEGRQQTYYFKGKQFYSYRPAFRKDAAKDSWLIVCIHGDELNFEEIIDLCQPLAKQMKASLLVPYFDPINFPDFSTFNLGSLRSDKHLLELIEHLGARANIKTREFYLLGFGSGGDFSQRISFFYPDRIARAAFTSSFFYPLTVENYFPEGLKTTPLAPDLQVDLLKVIKTDFAYILSPNQSGSREFREFVESIRDYTSRSQRSSRIRVRRMNEKQDNLLEAFNLGKGFLFPPE